MLMGRSISTRTHTSMYPYPRPARVSETHAIPCPHSIQVTLVLPLCRDFLQLTQPIVVRVLEYLHTVHMMGAVGQLYPGGLRAEPDWCQGGDVPLVRKGARDNVPLVTEDVEALVLVGGLESMVTYVLH